MNMKKQIRGFGSMLMVTVCLLFWGPSVEAEQEGGMTSELGKKQQLETITVTAQKTKENVQKVPMPVTTFNETAIEDADIKDVDDVVEFIPNMVFNDSSMKGFHETNFRGISFSQFTQKNPVVIFIDGVAQDNYANYGADILNIERIEILRGSQGTLYGKNAIGGVINIISKKPDNNFDSKITAELAENNTYSVKSFVNGPIIKDKLFFGISGIYSETDGYMENDCPDSDNFDYEKSIGLNSRLRWIPSDRMEINLHAGMVQNRDGADRSINAETSGVKYHEYRNPDDEADTDSFQAALNIGYDTGNSKFTSITTYHYFKNDITTDQCYMGTGQPVALSEYYYRTFSQELRIQSSDKQEGMKWIGGLYYSIEDSDWDDNGMLYSDYGVYYNWPDDTDENTAAAFGQITIPLPKRLALTAGLRYERVEKQMDYRYEVTSSDTGSLLSRVTYNIKDDWDVFLPKAALSWTVNEDTMIYTSVAKGYLAGGFNLCENVKDQAKFDEQSSIDYELGAKTSWFNNKLILNANLFYMDIKDMHVYSAPDGITYITSNAGKAHSRGIEIEAKARPLKGLDLIAAFGLAQAEYDEYTNTDGVNCAGNDLPISPDYTLNLAVQYRHDSGLFCRAGMQGYGQNYFNEANTVSQNAYQIYNAKIGYEGSNWDVYVYGKNLFDKEYFSFGRVNAVGISANVGEPQTFGIIISRRF